MAKSILFVDQFREVTGGQIVLQSLVRVAREAGYRVGVLAPKGGGLEKALRTAWGEQVELHDLRELSLQSGRKGWRDAWRLLAFSFYLLRFLRLMSGYDLVYVNGGRLAVPCALLSLLVRRPRWVYHLHLCHSGLEKKLLALIVRLPPTARLVLASPFIWRDLARRQPATARHPKVGVVENCLDAAFDGRSFVDRPVDADGPLTVALIGRVSSVKGHDTLPRLARALPDVRFVMIGRTAPDQAEFCRSLLADAPPNLVYAGETADLPGLVNQLPVHISLVPSRWEEPFGLVAIESMAMSCCTLVAARGMLPQIAAVTGAWCFGSDDELLTMLKRLRVMPPTERRELAMSQHAAALREYGFEKFRASVLRTLADATAGSNQPGRETYPTASSQMRGWHPR